MHIIINNPDVIEFDLNEALDVFISRKFILETCIWENGDDNWMKKKKKTRTILKIVNVSCLFKVYRYIFIQC